jgi:hypothetical protein
VRVGAWEERRGREEGQRPEREKTKKPKGPGSTPRRKEEKRREGHTVRLMESKGKDETGLRDNIRAQQDHAGRSKEGLMRGPRLDGKSGLERRGKERHGRHCIARCSVTPFLGALSGKPR